VDAPRKTHPIGSEVLTVMVMTSSTIWDIKPHSEFKVNGHFRAISYLQLQGQRISDAINQC
jgi:hypothetical protein